MKTPVIASALSVAIVFSALLLAGWTTAMAGSVNTGAARQAAFSVGGGASQMAAVDQPRGINVGGEGKMTVTPDMAVVDIGVESRASAIEAARARADQAMEAIRSSLQANGIEDNDIKTTHFSIMQERRFDKNTGKETMDGFRAAYVINVKIRHIEDTVRVIDGAVTAGGEVARVHNVYFTLQDPKPLLASLREEAVKDARSKGEQLAMHSGVTLGQPLYISEGGMPFPDFLRGGKGGGEMPSPSSSINPGQSEVRVNVQVVYGIE